MSQLFTPYEVKGVTLSNRIVMSPMCMYSCMNQDGLVTNWHRTHYTTRAVGRAGLIMLEATSVQAEGRISRQDLGIWSDEHLPGLSELASLVHEQGSKIGIQLAHAGRKADLDDTIYAPSAIAFNDSFKTPEAMDAADIRRTIQAFAEAAQRAHKAGFDVIELHAAHGYLINQFLSPLSNKREDEYGGSVENRSRLLFEVIDAVRKVWDGPLFVRISASDYHPDGMGIRDYIPIAARMKEHGVDLVDCSSGGVIPSAPISVYPGYQVPFAEEIRREAGIATGAVGLITEPVQAEEILQSGRADLVFLARELLRDPYWPRSAARKLGFDLDAPEQYKRAW